MSPVERTDFSGHEWQAALDNAKAMTEKFGFEASALCSLAEASASPRRFQLMIDALAVHQASHLDDKKDGWDLLVENVDESPFTLSEWLEAWELFNDWLGKRNRRANFINILGYLACCGQYLEGKAVFPAFCDLLEEMLEEYGFEGSEPCP